MKLTIKRARAFTSRAPRHVGCSCTPPAVGCTTPRGGTLNTIECDATRSCPRADLEPKGSAPRIALVSGIVQPRLATAGPEKREGGKYQNGNEAYAIHQT